MSGMTNRQSSGNGTTAVVEAGGGGRVGLPDRAGAAAAAMGCPRSSERTWAGSDPLPASTAGALLGGTAAGMTAAGSDDAQAASNNAAAKGGPQRPQLTCILE